MWIIKIIAHLITSWGVRKNCELVDSIIKDKNTVILIIIYDKVNKNDKGNLFI